MILSHKIALDPTVKQLHALARAAGVARFTWNWALAEWKKEYQAGAKPTGFSLKKKFNTLKGKSYPWVYDSPKDANQQPFSHLQTAFSRFFKKLGGYPNFKKKGVHDSFYISNDLFTLKQKSIRLPKIGWVRIREHLRFDGKISSATVSRVANRWYVSLQVDLGEFSKPRVADGVVGIDLGINQSIVLSDGTVYQAPNPLQKSLKRLRRANQSLSRKQKGSNRRRKAKDRLSKLHARISSIRQDFLHKTTTSIAKNHSVVVVEDLAVKEMTSREKKERFGRSVTDVGFYEFRRQLTYKSDIYRTKLIVADRWFPSSKKCSSCGSIKKKLSLGVRKYVCKRCGLRLDRDLNAAINLEHLAVGSTVSARGDRSSTVSKALIATSVCEARTKPCSLVSTS